MTIDGTQIECVVWEYEENFGTDNWSKSKLWFDAETHITLKYTEIFPSSSVQDLDDDANVKLHASHFSKHTSMQEYLTAVNKAPRPDFSRYQ